MHRNIAPLRVTQSSRASSRASGGFTTIVLMNSSPERSFAGLTLIPWINRYPDRPKRCLLTGRRFFTNSRDRRSDDWAIGKNHTGTLERLLGPAAGEKLAALARKRDSREIKTHRRARSAGAQSAIGTKPVQRAIF